MPIYKTYYFILRLNAWLNSNNEIHGFGTFIWKERREANNLTYLVKLLPRAGTESRGVHSSKHMKML